MIVFTFIVQSLAVFVVSSTAFDIIHWFLHRWQRSSIPLLRTFNAWHQVHHDFLGQDMQVRPELVKQNLWAHLVPEFLTSIIGTSAMVVIFPMWPVLAVVALHCVLFISRVRDEGVDVNHMSMKRLKGRRGLLAVSPSYHAMHHINPLAFYSSMLNVFDLIFGTSAQIRGKHIAVTGASGAFGGEMARQLEALGANVIRVGRDLDVDLEQVDILVLAHGARGGATTCFQANCRSSIELGERFIELGKDRLVPPEIWAVGSEAEIFGSDDYAMSKRRFAEYASWHWRRSDDVTYRHIVPSAFRSKMGWAPLGARWAVWSALFWIKRGFAYVPVTYTTLALWNFFAYRARGAVKPAFWQGI